MFNRLLVLSYVLAIFILLLGFSQENFVSISLGFFWLTGTVIARFGYNVMKGKSI